MCGERTDNCIILLFSIVGIILNTVCLIASPFYWLSIVNLCASIGVCYDRFAAITALSPNRNFLGFYACVL